jgi:hypothetical protein
LRQVASSPPPVRGQPLQGSMEPMKSGKGWVFKKEQPGGYSQSSNGASSEPFDPTDDPVQKLIIRQSAIKAAVGVVGPQLSVGGHPNPDLVREDLVRWVEWFERKTYDALSEPTTASSDDQAPPEPPAPVEGIDVTAIEDLLDLLETAERLKFDEWIDERGGLQKLTVKQKDSLYRRLAAA